MAYVQPRRDAEGNVTSYRLVVSNGLDWQGRQMRRYSTWTPPKPGMSEKQMEKAALAAAFKFEEAIKAGYEIDKHIKFCDYAEYVLDLKARNGLAPSTLDRYNSMLPRINEAIGHIKLNKIRPQHLNDFYQNLMEHGVRDDNVRAIAKHSLGRRFKEEHISKAELARRSSLGAMTITAALRGDPLRLTSAEAIARSMGYDVSDLFTIRNNEIPLSAKTVLEHHRLISMILSHADKEMVVPYNAAAKASPPRARKPKPDYFQPEEMEEIIQALEDEPIRWKAMTYLLIDTGCRRSEVMGLKWENVELDTGVITIETALLYTKEKGIYEGPPKNGQVRAVKLAPQSLALLKKYKLEQTRLRLLNGDRWVNSGYVFTKDDGQCMHPDSITYWLNQFSKKHNLPHIHPHAFRHTAASTMIANGVDLVTTAAELGHADATTTAMIYAHQIARQRAKAADIRAGVFSCIKVAK